MSWSGAGIPVLGGVTLSGTQTIVLKASTYTIEHPMPAQEGGNVEYLGKPKTRMELHGLVWESGSDVSLTKISGYINSWQPLTIASFNSGYYMLGLSGVGFLIENLKFDYPEGHGYPYYHFTIAGVTSGEFLGGVVPIPQQNVLTTSGCQLPWQSITYANGRWWIWFASAYTAAGTNSGYPQIGYVSSPDGTSWSAPTYTWTLNSGNQSSTSMKKLMCVQLTGTKFYYSIAATAVFSGSSSGNIFIWSEGTMNADGTTTFTVTNSGQAVTNGVNHASYVNADASGTVWVAATKKILAGSSITEVWVFSGSTWGDKTGGLNSSIVSGLSGFIGYATNLVPNTDGTAFLWTFDDQNGIDYYFTYSGGSWGQLGIQSGFTIGSNNDWGIYNCAVVISGANYALDAHYVESVTSEPTFLTRQANSGTSLGALSDSTGTSVWSNGLDNNAVTYAGGQFSVFGNDHATNQFSRTKSTTGASGTWTDQVQVLSGVTLNAGVNNDLRTQLVPANSLIGIVWTKSDGSEAKLHFIATPV